MAPWVKAISVINQLLEVFICIDTAIAFPWSVAIALHLYVQVVISKVETPVAFEKVPLINRSRYIGIHVTKESRYGNYLDYLKLMDMGFPVGFFRNPNY